MSASQPQSDSDHFAEPPVGAGESAPNSSAIDGANARLQDLVERQSTWIDAITTALDCGSSERAATNVVALFHSAIRSSRVALAMNTPSGLELAASSQQSEIQKRSSETLLLTQAMQEAIDQDRSIVCPRLNDDLCVTDAHERLIGGRNDSHIMTIPLVHREAIVGVALFELRKQACAGACIASSGISQCWPARQKFRRTNISQFSWS